MKRILSMAAVCVAGAIQAAHIQETMTLARGWNAIYLESTPATPACGDFFAGAPVERVATYHSDAYASTRQIADDGTSIDQKPISYTVWVPGDEAASTMASLAGGRVYMIYTTEAWSKTFFGVPAAPRQTYRATAGNDGFMNLAGVSSYADGPLTVKAYFAEGPFGTVPGAVAYQIGGTKTTGPSFLSMGITSSPRVQSGKAYALTATRAGDWPGVIGVHGQAVYFGPDANYASISVQNCGTTNHTFKFTVVRSDDWQTSGETLPPFSRRLPRVDAISAPAWTNIEESASWTVSLDAGETTDQIFSVERSSLTADGTYGGILVIEDLGASKMRVRLPINVAPAAPASVAFPTGLWLGEISISYVSGLNDLTPVPAGGNLRMNVMMHVDENRRCTLLQRVAFGFDTNGTARLFKELDSVPPEVVNPRRFSTVMMSVDTPAVTNTLVSGESVFGKNIEFTWTIDPLARDNPFRHAWHPDHDGKSADYENAAPSGDDFANYANPVKPELWSISNRIDFSWHEQGNRALPVVFTYTPDETTTGVVTWEVTGLTAKGPIASVGTFSLKRVFKAKELE